MAACASFQPPFATIIVSNTKEKLFHHFVLKVENFTHVFLGQMQAGKTSIQHYIRLVYSKPDSAGVTTWEQWV